MFNFLEPAEQGLGLAVHWRRLPVWPRRLATAASTPRPANGRYNLRNHRTPTFQGTFVRDDFSEVALGGAVGRAVQVLTPADS